MGNIPKDLRTGVVYKFICASRAASYVSETKCAWALNDR